MIVGIPVFYGIYNYTRLQLMCVAAGIIIGIATTCSVVAFCLISLMVLRWQWTVTHNAMNTTTKTTSRQ